ncbi:SWIM-type domain-containing protein [Aphis craccivora]|uniref:SWIM-type domain-containing protein n=1 Tax=Aphis craccivora TaxID=307492 RepID=A0A6G0YCQ3_APHCR|nr:SWIM-type domain-containing protein [Aphis craccivora]
MILQYRIIASNFHKVLKYIHQNKFPPSLFKTLLGNYNLNSVRSIKWGKNHEEVALNEFKNKYKIDVYLLYRNQDLKQCLSNKSDYIIYFDADINNYKLNIKHFDKIQGQINLTKSEGCILIIWTTKIYIQWLEIYKLPISLIEGFLKLTNAEHN